MNRSIRRVITLAALLLPLLLHAEEVQFSRSPGIYNRNILLTLSSENGDDLFYSFGEASGTRPQPYRFPLALSALSGEERSYSIVVYRPDGTERIGIYEYMIDKRLPEPPEPTVPSGSYAGPLSISFGQGKEALFYSIDATISENPRRWDGSEFELQPRAVPYSLYAYSRDEAGNISPLAVREYTVTGGEESTDAGFEILSPVTGSFLNRQFLYIRHSGLERLLYTYDGSDPRSRGIEYRGGALIDARGEIELKVSGVFSDGSFTPVKSLRLSVGGERGASVMPSLPDSGIYQSSQTLSFGSAQVRYTFEERIPSLDDLGGDRGLTLFSSPRGLTSYALRFRKINENGRLDEGQYRYYYVFDSRIPGEPIISVTGVPPYAERPRISISSPGYARVYYTLDGTSPSQGSPLYSGPFSPELTGGQGSILLRAVAYGQNGRRGEEAGQLIPYDLEAPGEPRVGLSEDSGSDRLMFEIDTEPDAEAVFEISVNGASPADPGPGSPAWKGEAVEVPWGMEADVELIAAGRDAAGNLSPPIRYSARIDRAPPPEPVLQREASLVRLEGDGRLYYALSLITDTSVAEENIEFAEYQEAVELLPVSGKLARYRVSAYAEDEAGNQSSIASMVFSVDDRLPTVPYISGIEDRRVYNSARREIRYSSPVEDFDLLYTLGTGEIEPEDPDLSSPSLQGLVIETEEGAELYYHLKVLPVFPEKQRKGRVRSIRFVVDRKIPQLPTVEGIPKNGLSRRNLRITLEGIAEDEQAYCLILDEEESALALDPVTDGIPYAEALQLEVPEGEERGFRLRVAVLDQAGNRADDPREYLVRIDRKPPEPPEVVGFPETGVSSGAVRLEFTVPNETSAEFRLLSEGELKRAGDIPFTLYGTPILVSGREGRSILYQLEYRSRDRAGNISEPAVRRQLQLDLRPVDQPSEPDIDLRGSGGFATISWRVPSGRTLYYALGAANEFSAYRAPLTVSLEKASDRRIRYYLENENGLKSAVHTLELEGGSEGTRSALAAGIEDGAVYGGEVVLRPVLRTEGIIRYEAESDRGLPVLTPYSPVLKDEIRFNVPRGSEKTFYVNLGLFEDRSSQLPQISEAIRFTIDKSPPPAPVLTELVNPDADSPYKLIRIEGRGNTVFFRLAGDESEASFSPYEDILKLDTRGRAGEILVIQAMTEDPAGNRSRLEEWSVLLDQDIIYVSSEGNDLYEGTRLRPFRSLEKALSVASRLRKGTLYIGEGSYPVQRSLVVEGNLDLHGGLDSETWQPAGLSIIESGRYLGAGSSLLTVKGRSEISNLRFADSRGVVNVPLRSENAAVRLINVDALGGSSFGLLIHQQRGTLTVSSSQITGGGQYGTILTLQGTLNIESSEIRAASLNEGRGVLNLEGGSLYLTDSSVRPDSGVRTAAVAAEGAYLVLRDSNLYSGQGSRRAVALLLKGGEVKIENSSILTESSGETTIGIDAQGSRLSITESSIELSGRNGASGFLLENSSLRMEHTDIRSRSNPGYLFLLQQKGGSAEFLNCTASLTARAEPILFDIAGGRLTLLHSTMLVSSSRGRSAGVHSRGGAQLYLTNSIISNTGQVSGTALEGEERDTWSILNSNFGGWANIASYGPDKAGSAEELDLLDADPFGGWLNGNRDEAAAASFADELYRLREASICVDGGVETGTELKDIDGEMRPNPAHGIRPFPDIGADEFYAGR
jgi:Fn3 associated/Bacterial Ig-like domain